MDRNQMPVRYEFKQDIESVFNLLTDPDFIVDRGMAMGELEVSCETEQQGDTTVVTVTRKLKQDFPAFIARMIDPVQTLHVTEHWHAVGGDGWKGEYVFEMEGQPVTIGASFHLFPTEEGCCYSIEHRPSARVPLVGRRIERYIKAQAEEGCTTELDYLRDRLRGN